MNAQFELVAAEGLGDITAESIRLRNIGDRANMTDWTLSDEDGNSFVFPVTLLFPQGEVVIYTRSGNQHGRRAILGQRRERMGSGRKLDA